MIRHEDMSVHVAYKVYQYPVKTDLVFDTKESAQEVATLIDAKVVEYFYDIAKWKNILAA